MSETTTQVPWRGMLRNAGEALAKDAFDDRADPETLTERTIQIMQLVQAALEARVQSIQPDNGQT